MAMFQPHNRQPSTHAATSPDNAAVKVFAAAAPAAESGQHVIAPDPAIQREIAARLQGTAVALLGASGTCHCGTPIINDKDYGWLHVQPTLDPTDLIAIHDALRA